MICNLAYYIDGLPSDLAMQSFYVGKTYVYVLQGQTDVYISRCKIDGKKAIYQDHMTIKGNGHTQTLDYYKGYFFSFTKPTKLNSKKKWATRPCKFKYEAGKTYNWNELPQITNCINYRAEGTLSNGVVALLRKHVGQKWTVRTYKASLFMLGMDKKTTLSNIPQLSRQKPFKGAFLPYGSSLQGCAYVNGLLYLIGGGIGQKPQLTILKPSTTSWVLSKRITLTHSDFGKKTEVEHIQVKKDGSRYIGVNDKSKKKYKNRIYKF